MIEIAKAKPEQVNRLIYLLDDNGRYLTSAKRVLKAAGFKSIEVFLNAKTAQKKMNAQWPDLFLVDIHLEAELDGLEFLQAIRKGGYTGKAVVVSADTSPEQFFRAALAGADDFLLKGTHVDIAKEVIRFLEPKKTSPLSQGVTKLGYLRTFGLTPKEIEILEEFSKGFPRYKDLSDRIGKTERQVRKVFSRVFSKLDIDNLAQLAHVLTVCDMLTRK